MRQTWGEQSANHSLFLRLLKREAPVKRLRGSRLGRLLCRWGLHSWQAHYDSIRGAPWNEYTVTRVCKRPHCRLERTDHGDVTDERGAF